MFGRASAGATSKTRLITVAKYNLNGICTFRLVRGAFQHSVNLDAASRHRVSDRRHIGVPGQDAFAESAMTFSQHSEASRKSRTGVFRRLS